MVYPTISISDKYSNAVNDTFTGKALDRKGLKGLAQAEINSKVSHVVSEAAVLSAGSGSKKTGEYLVSQKKWDLVKFGAAAVLLIYARSLWKTPGGADRDFALVVGTAGLTSAGWGIYGRRKVRNMLDLNNPKVLETLKKECPTFSGDFVGFVEGLTAKKQVGANGRLQNITVEELVTHQFTPRTTNFGLIQTIVLQIGTAMRTGKALDQIAHDRFNKDKTVKDAKAHCCAKKSTAFVEGLGASVNAANASNTATQAGFRRRMRQNDQDGMGKTVGNAFDMVAQLISGALMLVSFARAGFAMKKGLEANGEYRERTSAQRELREGCLAVNDEVLKGKLHELNTTYTRLWATPPRPPVLSNDARGGGHPPSTRGYQPAYYSATGGPPVGSGTGTPSLYPQMGNDGQYGAPSAPAYNSVPVAYPPATGSYVYPGSNAATYGGYPIQHSTQDDT